MPIYEYRALSPCLAKPACSGVIEVLAKISDADLRVCPDCGVAIEKLISASKMAVSQSHLLKEKNFAERGFTQYRKAGGGVYEKTAGDGPRYISGDD